MGLPTLCQHRGFDVNIRLQRNLQARETGGSNKLSACPLTLTFVFSTIWFSSTTSGSHTFR